MGRVAREQEQLQLGWVDIVEKVWSCGQLQRKNPIASLNIYMQTELYKKVERIIVIAKGGWVELL